MIIMIMVICSSSPRFCSIPEPIKGFLVSGLGFRIEELRLRVWGQGSSGFVDLGLGRLVDLNLVAGVVLGRRYLGSR